MKTIILSKCDTRGLSGAKFAYVSKDTVWAVGRTVRSCLRDLARGAKAAGVVFEKGDGEVFAIEKVLP